MKLGEQNLMFKQPRAVYPVINFMSVHYRHFSPFFFFFSFAILNALLRVTNRFIISQFVQFFSLDENELLAHSCKKIKNRLSLYSSKKIFNFNFRNVRLIFEKL